MSNFPTPRPFQEKAHNLLRRGFSEGHMNQIVMAPTGAGKTYLGLRVISEALARGKRAMFVCDRTTLIEQTSSTAESYGLREHGIIQANHWRWQPHQRFQIASAQTLARRGFPPDVDVVVVDEAHTQLKAWVDYAKTKQSALIGLSATPFSKGLGRIFSNLINATTMQELTQSGVLVPMRAYTCTRANMDGAETKGGEWTEKAAEERGMEIIGNVVKEWITYAEGRKTIVFGSSIAHCNELCRQFNEVNIPAAVFTSKTTAKERQELLNEYRKEDSFIRVLISVEALAKGFDVKDVGCVVDCRPMRKSISTVIQMWGRGLRASKETGKEDCILLDHSGNITRFLNEYEDIYFNGLNALDSGEKLDQKIRKKEDEREPASCPKCGHSPFFSRCMSCGHEKIKESLVVHEQGQMQAVVLGKKQLADSKYHLWSQLCTYAREHSKPESQAGRAYHLYRAITKENPPWNFYSTQPASLTLNTYNKIRQMNIAYSKGRKYA
ncbi:DEAD/DEAH box helicase [Taylorella asinigenitalis]|uniref:Putative helicase n=1 Tax=Taylorella asinigenitalis (strain MCE3) TaxID=1008459 RepID=G4QCS6_TAYAM|nr:DEAD/DEAH box helicase family protein [Taylorella asinigenitalis]AEP36206.1 putative helicase [Taylorella asinigenitalis MCE3]